MHSLIKAVSICCVFAAFPSKLLPNDNGPTFKFVKVEDRPIGSKINIQIDPEEQKQLLEPSSELIPEESVIEEQSELNVPVSVASNWFWSKIEPSIEAASPLRLEKAMLRLGEAPAEFSPIRTASLQEIVDQYGSEIMIASLQAKVSPAFILAVIAAESSGKSDAVSNKGAVGLMQLIPETAARFGVKDPTDVAQNIRGGAQYLRWLLDNFQGDPLLALAGYNAGENAVKTANGVPPYDETRNYVPKVASAWQSARLLCTAAPILVTEPCIFRSKVIK